jgi:hypothetical protein
MGLNMNMHGVHIGDDDVCRYQIQLHQQYKRIRKFCMALSSSKGFKSMAKLLLALKVIGEDKG